MTQITAPRQQALTLPGTARGGWEIAPGAALEALAALDLTMPVEVKITSAYHKRGSMRIGADSHVVFLTTDLSPEQASETLWHELVHCAQRERHPVGIDGAREFSDRYRAASVNGWAANPFEIEAIETATAMSEFVLTRSAAR